MTPNGSLGAPGVEEFGEELGDSVCGSLGETLGGALGEALGKELGEALGKELGETLGLIDGDEVENSTRYTRT